MTDWRAQTATDWRGVRTAQSAHAIHHGQSMNSMKRPYEEEEDDEEYEEYDPNETAGVRVAGSVAGSASGPKYAKTSSGVPARNDGPTVELRWLLPAKNAGAIIGKGGQMINRLRQQARNVKITDSTVPEVILTIHCPLGTACETLMDIIPILEENKDYEDLDFECVVRILIHQSQAGKVIGKAGVKIKELQQEAGLSAIKVFPGLAPQSTERCVQMTGKPQQVVNCIAAIFELLEESPVIGFVGPYDPVNNYDQLTIQNYGGYMPGAGGRRPGMRGRGRGGGPGGHNMFGNNNIGPHNSTKVSIPKDMGGAIIGVGGERIRKICQESGANIQIDEAEEGSNDRIISIHGSADAIQNARYLLQMCIKQYQAPPDVEYEPL